jgi:tripartite-type tricarboxylate transporter receptor subunit TctC
MKLRIVLRSLLAVAAAATLAGPALADNDAPVRILVGATAGGGTDIIARHLALVMQQELGGRSVLVENKPGAGGQLAAQALKAAKPDGQTLFLANSHAISMIPLTVANPGYEAAKDFAPVALVAVNPDVFVISPQAVGAPVAGLREFAQWSKANPGKGNVGIPAPASAPEFAVSLISRALNADLSSVPYRGDAPIMQDLMAGQIAAGIGSVGTMTQPARSGKVKMLAVNGTTRLPQWPDVPTYAELGIKGYEEVIFTAMFAPAGTPPDVIRGYSAALSKIVKSPEFIEKLASLGLTATFGTPAELNARVQATHTAWTAMVRNAGYKPQ